MVFRLSHGVTMLLLLLHVGGKEITLRVFPKAIVSITQILTK